MLIRSWYVSIYRQTINKHQPIYFCVKLVLSGLPNVCLLIKLESNALPNALISADH